MRDWVFLAFFKITGIPKFKPFPVRFASMPQSFVFADGALFGVIWFRRYRRLAAIVTDMASTSTNTGTQDSINSGPIEVIGHWGRTPCGEVRCCVVAATSVNSQ